MRAAAVFPRGLVESGDSQLYIYQEGLTFRVRIPDPDGACQTAAICSPRGEVT
jgi:hypothetical protein